MAVAALLALRCLDSDEAWGSIDAAILIMIFSMLMIGAGLQASGALSADRRRDRAAAGGPLAAAHPVRRSTCSPRSLTETVTNNAVAVVLTPLVVGLAAQLGIDPRPFVVAVMFGASASFATPIGYQTNTLVYGAGDYRFADFLRVGIPMNLIVGVAVVLTIPLFFPLG